MIDKLSWLFIEKAHAQADPNSFFGLFDPFSAQTGGNTGDAQGTFVFLMTKVTFWIVALASITAFIYLVVSGIQYITAGGDADKATKARTGIINAIIGIVVVALAWVIISFAAGLGKNLGGAN